MSEWVKKQLSQLALLSKGQQMAKIHLEKEGDYYVLNGGQNPSGYLNKWNTEADTISATRNHILDTPAVPSGWADTDFHWC